MRNHYDYIITGAGCAGMSLLMRMMQDDFFLDKQILIIDKAAKTANDRTWCFWEKEDGLFESIVTKQWDSLGFYAAGFSSQLRMAPYRYKMISGIDLYQHVMHASAKYPNIEWRFDTVQAVTGNSSGASVQVSTGKLTADYVFNSILFKENELAPFGDHGYHLLQHFKGWVIETADNYFDADSATFMDFRISQDQGTTFMYVLPVSPKKALIEFTLFSEKLLPPETYINNLQTYISSVLKINEYTIEHEEWGVIPMTNYVFPQQQGNLVQMGVAGGQVKGSSGYAFQFIQKRTAAIIKEIKNGSRKFNKRGFNEKKFHLFDSVLLRVLHFQLMPGDQIFAAIFKKNPPERVFRFLDNETNLWDDLLIMRSVPISVFLPAALKELLYLP